MRVDASICRGVGQYWVLGHVKGRTGRDSCNRLVQLKFVQNGYFALELASHPKEN